MKLTTTLVLALTASASLASAQDPQEPRDAQQPELRLPCPEWSVDACGGPHHEVGQRVRRETPRQVWDPNLAQWRTEHPRQVWDPNLAQWRVESPRKVWDPNLAQYRSEGRQEVWDPYLARYRPRDARKDPPAPARASDGRHRHPGRSDWCYERH